MILAALLLAVAPAPVPPAAPKRTDVPVSELNAPDLLFTCMENGLPTANIHYGDGHRYLDYALFGEGGVMLELTDAVKSVVHERGEQSQSWLIRAEGPARNTRGTVAEGAPARMDMAIHSRPDGLTADYTVRVAHFSRTSTGCGLMPPRPKPPGTEGTSR